MKYLSNTLNIISNLNFFNPTRVVVDHRRFVIYKRRSVGPLIGRTIEGKPAPFSSPFHVVLCKSLFQISHAKIVCKYILVHIGKTYPGQVLSDKSSD